MGCAAFGFLVRRPHNNITLPPTFTNPVLVKMAKKYGVTVSQVVLRSLLDRNIVPVSTSSNKEHIKLNEDIFDFHLSHKEIQEIKKFDKNEKVHPIEVDDMRKQYEEMKSYIKKNNLTQYENI
ncbi:aldo-keto reductase AKR2E4 [Bicyclus anynana]|uniref:Aldo-keto reductase AKR2E4 n=1 Tax=Bicyclus anynana TaxID=110368 RepID=A0A6J1NAD7_BICAN|nr:aldo-keto reductase AKR2E4 [Bicyclus anynana]